MTIGKKLMISFGGLLALMVALSYASLSSIGTLGSYLDEAANKTARKVELSGQIQTSVARMRAEVRNTILSTVMKADKDLKNSRQNFQTERASVEAAVKEIRPMLLLDSGRRAADRIEQNL